MSATIRRCPIKEGSEVRLYLIPTPSGADLALQIFRRAGHEITAPMGSTATVVRVPIQFAPHLCEMILELSTVGPRE